MILERIVRPAFLMTLDPSALERLVIFAVSTTVDMVPRRFWIVLSRLVDRVDVVEDGIDVFMPPEPVRGESDLWFR